MENLKFPMRINKYLSHKNYTTRKGADKLIESGNVFINGKKAILGDKVQKDDEVTVEGVEKKNFVYYLYYKPTGVVTINAQDGEKEISDVMKFDEEVFPLGRLDKDSEGLIVMTNDGRITKKLLDPDFEHEKEYVVRVNKPITHQMLVRLRLGVKIGNYKTKKTKIRRLDKYTFEIILTEGKNRQIRKMAGSEGYKVTELKRIRIMNLEAGKLKANMYRKLRGYELKDFLNGLDN